MKYSITLCLAILCIHINQAQQIIYLESKPAPAQLAWQTEERSQQLPPANTEMVSNVSKPSLTVYQPEPEKANGTSLIIAPGGGFHFLSMQPCEALARWCAERGITAFVLKYRVYPTGDNPMQEFIQKVQADQEGMDRELAPLIDLAVADGRAAIQYVRENHSDFGLSVNKIGILGYSAGGTLAAAAALQHDLDTRPDFSAPIYGAMHVMDLKTLPADPMPLFIAVTADDGFGFQKQSIEIFQSWNKAKQPAELHVYETGGHGFGMREQNTTSDLWIQQFEAWLKFHSFL